MEGLTIRKAKPVDAAQIARLYSQAYQGNYSLLEYTDPEQVRRILKEKDYIWFIAKKDKKVISSAVAVPDPWNDSFEIGRTATDKGYGNGKVAKTLCSLVRDQALKEHQLGWATIRNTPIYKISLNDLMTVVGYTSIHFVGERETHLLCMRLTEKGKRLRVVPEEANELYKEDIVKEICDKMELREKKEEYPVETVVGPDNGLTFSLRAGSLYHDVDRSLTITSLDEFPPPAEYFQVTVLADKISAIDLLRRFNFKMSAFLPGWYQKDGKRYDCVLMENSNVKPKIDDSEINAILQELIKKFEK